MITQEARMGVKDWSTCKRRKVTISAEILSIDPKGDSFDE